MSLYCFSSPNQLNVNLLIHIYQLRRHSAAAVCPKFDNIFKVSLSLALLTTSNTHLNLMFCRLISSAQRPRPPRPRAIMFCRLIFPARARATGNKPPRPFYTEPAHTLQPLSICNICEPRPQVLMNELVGPAPRTHLHVQPPLLLPEDTHRANVQHFLSPTWGKII